MPLRSPEVKPTLLDRPRSASTPHPLDWPSLAAAFEAACLLRCVNAPTTIRHRRDTPVVRPPESVEFNREDAAQRMRHLLDRFDVSVSHERAVGGLRRRYELHRLTVSPAQPGYAAMLYTGWRRGRGELLGGPMPGASGLRRMRRAQLAAAAWRAALLAGGRHIRRHILGVRLTDRELAAVLVRSAALLDVPAILRPGTGCYLVSVAQGPESERIMQATELGATPPGVIG